MICDESQVCRVEGRDKGFTEKSHKVSLNSAGFISAMVEYAVSYNLWNWRKFI